MEKYFYYAGYYEYSVYHKLLFTHALVHLTVKKTSLISLPYDKYYILFY